MTAPRITAAALLLITLFVLPGFSDQGHKAPAYHYYDGPNKRTVYLRSDVVVDFQTDARTEALIRRYNGTVVERSGKVTVWRTRSGQPLVLKDMNKDMLSEAFVASPPGIYTQSSVKAIPGGIIVRFKEGWKADQIQRWLNDRNLGKATPLIRSMNVWIVDSPAGLAALQQANELHESGETIYASPNWWEKLITK